MSARSNIQRIVTLALAFILVAGVMGWFQLFASPAAAQEPGEPQLVILVVPVGEDVATAEVTPPPVFNVGDIFKVAIVAQGVESPGIFGGQFELTFDTNYLQAVAGSLEPGADLQVSPVQGIDNTTGLITFAGSRQGDVDNLTGDVVLATVSFEAVAATEPPEGQTTTLHLQNVKLGAKGGIEVPIAGTADLSVIIRPDGTGDGEGDIVGNAIVEGRAADNQAGHTITATDAATTTLTTTTAITGSFLFDNAPAGTYSVTASRSGFLSATCEGVVHTADALTTLADVVLLAGDIDDSGEIDITDATAIGAVFGSTGPEVADLNDDGVVDILDLILMAANFGQTSAGNPWVC